MNKKNTFRSNSKAYLSFYESFEYLNKDIQHLFFPIIILYELPLSCS